MTAPMQRLDVAPHPGGCVWHHRYAGEVRAPHRHEELELNLVVGGAASYLLGERRYELRHGSLVWLFPAQEHVLLGTEGHEMWIVVWSPALLSKLGDEARRLFCAPLPPAEPCRRLLEDDTRTLLALIEELAALQDAPKGAMRDDELSCGLRYVLLRAWNAFGCASALSGRDVHPAVEKAARLLRQKPQTESVESLARECGLSASRLSRVFREQTGVGLVEFRAARRVELFLRLYSPRGGCSMDACALQAGFQSYAAFHRAFRDATGLGPAAYFRARRSDKNGARSDFSPAERSATRLRHIPTTIEVTSAKH